METYITLDIGGTFIKFGLVTRDGKLSAVDKVATPINQDKAIIQTLHTIIQKFQKEKKIAGIGISTAGIVDRAAGEIVYAGPTIQSYRGTNFKEELAMYDLPIHVKNDVDAALVGEIWRSHIDPEQATYCLTLGTGIGGALYHNGLQNGANAQGNSLGYLLYDPATQTNYEMRASTTALNSEIRKAFGDKLSTEKFFDYVKEGQDVALTIFKHWIDEVAKGIAQIILLVDPAQIIIGGGISAQGEFLREAIETQVPAYLPEQFMKTKLTIAKEQNNASLYGAVFSFFQ